MGTEAAAEPWWEQADSALNAADALASAGLFHWACFCCQQAAELALKAFLLKEGRRDLLEHHSVADLLRAARRFAPELREHRDAAKALDWHYLKARYPQARYRWQPPQRLYNRRDYEVCRGYASEIVKASRAASRRRHGG